MTAGWSPRILGSDHCRRLKAIAVAATTAAAASSGASGLYGFTPPAYQYLHVVENRIFYLFHIRGKGCEGMIGCKRHELARLGHFRSRAQQAKAMRLTHGMDLTRISGVL